MMEAFLTDLWLFGGDLVLSQIVARTAETCHEKARFSSYP